MDMTTPPATPVEALTVIGQAFLAIFFGSALLRGTWRHFADLTSAYRYVGVWRRRNKPLNKVEQTVTAIIADIVTDPENWNVIKDKSGYHLQKGSVRVRKCDHPRWEWCEYAGYVGPRIQIGETADYLMNAVRPELTLELYKTIDNLRAQRACMETLEALNPPNRMLIQGVNAWTSNANSH